MFRHSLLLIYRNFRRVKSTFFINLIGLSTGLACTLLIYLWVSDELAVDKFHEKGSRLYQVMENHEQNGSIITQPSTSGLLAKELVTEMPEIEYAVPVAPPFLIDEMVLSHQDKKLKGVGQFVGQDFFNVFSYDLLKGNAGSVLLDKKAIVLSERMALQLFNTTENVVGKQLEWESEERKESVLISGIFKNVPANSSDQFDFLLSYESFLGQDDTFLNWGNYGPFAYLVVKEGTNVAYLNQKIKNFISLKTGSTFRALFLTKYTDNYLHGKYENGKVAGGRIQYVKLFSIVAVFILVIACINFMNLSTARASGRIKEISVKKTFGAGRKELIFQFMLESVAMAFLALALALIVVVTILPQFNAITGKSLTLQLEPSVIAPFLFITFLTGIISGSYPAFYFSGFNPISILRGNSAGSGSSLWVRKGLVVFQFTLSVILIVGVVVVYKQINFIQSKSLGYNKENLLTFEPTGKVAANKSAFLAEARKIPGVVNASSIGHSMVSSGAHTLGVYWEGKDLQSTIPFEIAEVDYELLETIGVQLVAGRTFSPKFGAENKKIICNEAALEAMRMQPNALGKSIALWSPENKMELVGVVKNFHFESLHQNIKPLFFVLDPVEADEVMVRIEAGKEREVLQGLEKLQATFSPGTTLDYSFLDDTYQALYVSEQRVSVLSRYFAGLAILISCLGLFGLATFTAERRRKEIGVRKVLGASVYRIVYLLSGEFTKLVLVAVFISLPLSYFIVNRWLTDFAYRINLEWWYFAGAGFLALAVALFTVSFQAIKAATVNPIKSLKNE